MNQSHTCTKVLLVRINTISNKHLICKNHDLFKDNNSRNKNVFIPAAHLVVGKMTEQLKEVQ